MPVKKSRRAPQKKWSTKMKQNPVKELKSNWKSMGVVGKLAAVSIGAGLVGGAARNQIDSLPVVGRFMAIGSGLGARLRSRLSPTNN